VHVIENGQIVEVGFAENTVGEGEVVTVTGRMLPVP
jgi:hypothetical protein